MQCIIKNYLIYLINKDKEYFRQNNNIRLDNNYKDFEA